MKKFGADDVELRRLPIAWGNLDVTCRCGRVFTLRVDMRGLESYRCSCGRTHRLERAMEAEYVVYGPPGSE